MSHNVGNGGTFGIDAYMTTPDLPFPVQPPMVLPPECGEAPKLPPESKMTYFITDYEQSIKLNPSDAALGAILILKDVLERNLLSHLKRPSQAELAELKAIVEKVNFWD